MAALTYPASVDTSAVPLPVMETNAVKPADMHAANARTAVPAETSSKLEASPDLSLRLSTLAEEPADSLHSSSDATPLQGLAGDMPVGPQSNEVHVRLAQQQASMTVDSGGQAPKGKQDCSAEAQPACGACLGASQSVLAGTKAQAVAEQPPAAAAHAANLPRPSSASPAASQESPAGSTHRAAAGHSVAARAAGPEAAVRIAGSQPATQTALLPALAGSSTSRAAGVLTTGQAPATSVAAAVHAARLAGPSTAAVEAALQTGAGAQSPIRQQSSLDGTASGGVLGCSRAASHEPRAAIVAHTWTPSGLATRAHSPAAAAAAAAPGPKLQPSRGPEAERPASEAEGAAHQHRLKRQRAADASASCLGAPSPGALCETRSGRADCSARRTQPASPGLHARQAAFPLCPCSSRACGI